MVDKPTYNWGHHLVKPEVPKAILRFQMFIQFGSSTKLNMSTPSAALQQAERPKEHVHTLIDTAVPGCYLRPSAREYIWG